ncbi:MAG: UDP-N-acetylmuramoyl-L-alanyl-D-glutamate--2,6-diaminopimelate ligase, partial [Deltaproteobacteria bacterium]|nr:UDP-N-acetylmuramoyl-L-alanyl-D-glutamate--2,6-diaminopimelate ligase [Deltaproteobacteria bacterium]
MKLKDLIEGISDYEVIGGPEKDINALTYDSRHVHPGDLFVALRGNKLDGHDYLQDAVQRGAAALLAERLDEIRGNVTRIRVSDTRNALSQLAVRFYEYPFDGISLTGITGTNGKTTTSYILESILLASGSRTGVIGTINYRYSGTTFPAPVTTPESLDLMRLVREMADHEVNNVIMEVSSHALDQGRTKDCPFKVAVFTNFSRDHLDYHKTMDAYFDAKSQLFRHLARGKDDGRWAVINLDDARGKDLARLTRANVLFYGHDPQCDVRAVAVESDHGGLRANLITPRGERKVASPLLGEFNIYNIMAASSAAIALDIHPDAIVAGIAALKSVPGRLEPVENHRGLRLVVDYAHTPDALLKTILALRPLNKGRLITVFGCGGDRDKGKRQEMGTVAGQDSDVVIITSDNPRTENPLTIMEQIERGIQKTALKKRQWPPPDQRHEFGYFVEVDRREAI